MRICVMFLLCTVSILILPRFGAGQPHQPTQRTLLLDHLDESFTPDGSRCTTPSVINPSGAFTGGRPRKGGQFVDGRFGKALQFHGLMDMRYPAQGNIDLSAGLAEFWVALNFDAEEVIKDPGRPSEAVPRKFTRFPSRRQEARST